MPHRLLAAYHEKIFFGVTTLFSTSCSMLGVMMTSGETRWLYATLAASSMTSGFLALMFKRADESMRIVIGRCGFAVLGGVFATRPVVHHLGFEEIAETDIISLSGISAAVCIATFFVGFKILSVIEKRSPELAEKWFRKISQ